MLAARVCGSLIMATVSHNFICLLLMLTLQTSADSTSPCRIFMSSEHFKREKHALFLPFVISLFLTTSVVTTGLAGGSLGHSIIVTNKLAEQFQLAIEASAESLASLQRQITSLAQVTLQARHALDLLTAEKGGTCLFLKEKCYYVNESGLIELQVHKLHKLSEDLQRQKFSRAATDWWESSMFSLLMPLVGPLLCVLLIAILGPFILNRLIGFIRQ